MKRRAPPPRRGPRAWLWARARLRTGVSFLILALGGFLVGHYFDVTHAPGADLNAVPTLSSSPAPSPSPAVTITPVPTAAV